MKTLKKTLSLTLVFALVFSLMSFAFAADTTATTTTTATAATKLSDFTDKDQLTYTEAADYLIAAGVVKGDTATTLNPQGDFTREQAAKLIAYACLGQTAADNLKAGSAPFTDVAADRWSAGYIAYCQKQGIINGYGDGTFNPAAKVTGYQYAKMLLCALGYGVNGEFTGAGWDLEVAKLALAKDIFKDHTAGASNASANREEAFLYTFNALTNAMIVNYNKSLNVYYSGTNPFENNQLFDKDYTIGYQRFKMEKVSDGGTYAEDAHYWAIDGKTVTDTYSNEPITVLATVTKGGVYSDFVTKGKDDYIGFSNDTDKDGNDAIVYYLNGDKQTAAADIAAVKTAAGVRGNVTKFIDTNKNNKYDTVEVLVYNVAKLDAAPSIKTAAGNDVVTIGVIGMTNVVDSKIKGDYKGLAKDDYVLYYKNSANKWTIAKCETLSGQMFGFNDAASKANINGVEYDYSRITKVNGNTAWTDITATKGLAATTFYFDAGKNLVAAEPTEAVVAAANVVFVLDNAANMSVVSAELLKSDGSVVTKTVDTVFNTSNQSEKATTGNVAKNTFFTYTENASGVVTLKAIGSAITPGAQVNSGAYSTAGKAVFTKGNASFFTNDAGTALGTKGTNKTVFVIENEAAAKDGTFTAYTGVSNIPNAKAEGTATKAYVLNDKDGYAVMAVALDVALTNVSKVDYVFVGAPASTVTMTGNSSEDYYKYNYAVVNGEIKAFDATSDANAMIPFAPLAKDGINYVLGQSLYAVNAYDNGRADGYMSTGDADYGNLRISPTVNKVLAHTFDVVGNTVTMPNAIDAFAYAASGGVTMTPVANSFVVSDDLKVFVHDVSKMATGGGVTIEAGTKGTLENYTSLDNVIVNGLRVSKDDNTINELYLTVLPATTTGGGTGGTVVATTGTVTYVDPAYAYVIVGNTEIPVIGSAAEFFTNSAVVVGDKISYTLSTGTTPKMTALTAIKPASGTVTFNAAYSAFSGLTVDGDVLFKGAFSYTATNVTITGDLAVGDNASVATNLTAKTFDVTGKTDIKSNGTVSFNSKLRGDVTVDVGAAGTATFTNVTFGKDVEVKTTAAATNATIKNSTIAGNFKATDDATFDGTVTVKGTITGADKITAASTADAATKTLVSDAQTLKTAQDTLTSVAFTTATEAKKVIINNTTADMEYSLNGGEYKVCGSTTTTFEAGIGDKIVIRVKATPAATKTLTVAAANLKAAAAPTLTSAKVAGGSGKTVVVAGSGLDTDAKAYEVKVLRGPDTVADWTKVTFSAATGGDIVLTVDVKTDDVFYVRAAAPAANQPAGTAANVTVTAS